MQFSELHYFIATKYSVSTKQVQGKGFAELTMGSVMCSVNRFHCCKPEELPNSVFKLFYLCIWAYCEYI